MDRVNRRLKAARANEGVIQVELSQKTGIPVPTLSLFERGFYRPTKEQAEKIAEVLNVSVEEIFPK